MIMKALHSLCVILFILCINSAAQEESDVVLDIRNNELKVGSKYYIWPVAWGLGGGGFGLSNFGNTENCEETVTREPCDNEDGIPVSFHPADPHETVIRLSKSLNIKYETPVRCANSTVWSVGAYNATLWTRLIQIGGVQGKPGCETARSWFKIERGSYVSGYKFFWKPSDVCNKTLGGTALISAASWGKRPVVLGETGYEVRFAKYDDFVGGKDYLLQHTAGSGHDSGISQPSGSGHECGISHPSGYGHECGISHPSGSGHECKIG